MGDTCYPNFVPFMMYEFGTNLYLNYLNILNPSPRINMKLKTSSVDPVKGNGLPNNDFGINDASRHKYFK